MTPPLSTIEARRLLTRDALRAGSLLVAQADEPAAALLALGELFDADFDDDDDPAAELPFDDPELPLLDDPPSDPPLPVVDAGLDVDEVSLAGVDSFAEVDVADSPDLSARESVR